MMKGFWSGKRVTVTGGAGFLGTHLVRRLELMGASVFVPRQRDYNLTALDACMRCLLEHPCDMLVHAAAYYGGIGINVSEPATLYYRNLVMGANLMEAARLAKVGKFVAIGTACSYPGYLEGHLKEEDLWAGPCHASVVNYGLTKKMMAVQAQAYKKQYGLDSIHLILTNLYGPGDSYNPERSHVVAALVRKYVEAEIAKAPSVEVWGTGKPIREFLYVEDCADAIVLAAEQYNDAAMPLNIGTGIGTSIRELAETTHAASGFKGQDRLEHRQARRRPGEGARRDPDEAGPRRLDPADGPQERPRQDGRLVPGQQGPGGREMVNDGRWLRAWPGTGRAGSRPHLRRDPGAEASVALGPPAGPTRLLFINQYYWPDHASTAQHLTDLAEGLAARRERVPRRLQPGGLPPGLRASRRATRSTTGSTSTASPRRPWGAGAR